MCWPLTNWSRLLLAKLGEFPKSSRSANERRNKLVIRQLCSDSWWFRWICNDGTSNQNVHQTNSTSKVFYKLKCKACFEATHILHRQPVEIEAECTSNNSVIAGLAWDSSRIRSKRSINSTLLSAIYISRRKLYILDRSVCVLRNYLLFSPR